MLGSLHGRALLAAAALVFICAAVAAAVSAPPARAFLPTLEPVWAKTFDGGTNLIDRASDIGVFENTVWVCGTWRDGTVGQDMALVRVPTIGLRARAFTWKALRGRDAALALAIAGDGSVYTAGYSGGATKKDLRLVKWSSLGKVLWTKRYDGSSHGDDQATDVAVDRWGNVTVCGWTITGSGTRMVVASYNASGGERWVRLRHELRGVRSAAEALCVDSMGNVYVTGERWSTNTQAITVKYSRSGDVLWTRSTTAGGTTAYADSIARCPSGGVYVAGSVVHDVTGQDPLVMRYTSAGALTFFSNGTDVAQNGRLAAVAVASDGSVIAGGNQADECTYNPQAMLYASSGTLSNTWTWPDSSCEWDARIAATAADDLGHVYWAGYQMKEGSDMRPIIDCQPVGAGDGAWTGAWTAGGSFVQATDCVVAGATLYVAGVHDKGAQGTNLFVLKYAP
jgi:hypothetical protein